MKMIATSIKLNRENMDFDAAVNRGIAAALIRNRSVGVKIMLDAGVPQSVITRVLMDSRKNRRASDWD
jgi:hypothetical protein